MRVIIAGAGSVGRYMAGQLQSAGHEVTLLDQDQRVVKRGMSSGDPAGVTWREADACEVSSLADAGAQHADVIAAVTGDDEDNLVISLLAKQEFGVPRVVARVNNPKNEWMFNEMWGEIFSGFSALQANVFTRSGHAGNRACAIRVVKGESPVIPCVAVKTNH